MDDLRTGRKIRAIRHSRRWRQQDLADESRTSQDMISRLERGRIGGMPVERIRDIAQALDAEILLVVRWRGGELDRLLDEGHATIVGRTVQILQSLGWQTQSEVSYSIYGERGSIDVLAWHPGTRTLLVVEVKSELTSVEETLRVHDAKLRLAPRIAADRFGWHAAGSARLLVLPDLSTARRRVARHSAVLTDAYPLRGHAMRSWLIEPGSLAARRHASGILFVSPTHWPRGRNGPVTESGCGPALQPRRERKSEARLAQVWPRGTYDAPPAWVIVESEPCGHNTHAVRRRRCWFGKRVARGRGLDRDAPDGRH